MKRITLIYVDNCGLCKKIAPDLSAFCEYTGFALFKRKPTLEEHRNKTWSGGFPTFVIECGGNRMLLAGDKVIPTLMGFKDQLKQDNITTNEIHALLQGKS